MADDKRVAKLKLENLLMTMSWHRNALAAYRNKWDVAGVERCERALEFDYSRIRAHCAKNGLELPDDVPSRGVT
jgi:hypothetical protein